MSSASIGKRLTHLRAIIAARSSNPKEWSRANLARTTGLSPAVIARLEQRGTGTAANLVALLEFYQCQGFNLAWILASDEERVPLYTFQDAFQNADVSEAFDYMDRLRQLVQKFKLGGQLDQAAVNTFLLLLEERNHQALVHLLPRIRDINNEADLRVYQRYLPPVAAASAGWRSRSIHLLPLHYYEAGESIPRCGVPYYYLTYETKPELFPSSSACPCCKEIRSNN